MKPNEVNASNEQYLRDTVYNYKRLIPQSNSSVAEILSGDNFGQRRRQPNRIYPKFKIGDHVRLSRYRTVFEKGYTPNFTTEIFTIRKVQRNTDPITYLLSDYNNIEIKGSVYTEELTPVAQPDVYLVEKIIRKRNDGKVLVKWLGFGSEHNSYINEEDVL